MACLTSCLQASTMPIYASELEPTKLPPGVKLSHIIKTVPHDARNPNVNQVWLINMLQFAFARAIPKCTRAIFCSLTECLNRASTVTRNTMNSFAARSSRAKETLRARAWSTISRFCALLSGWVHVSWAISRARAAADSGDGPQRFVLFLKAEIMMQKCRMVRLVYSINGLWNWLAMPSNNVLKIFVRIL